LYVLRREVQHAVSFSKHTEAAVSAAAKKTAACFQNTGINREAGRVSNKFYAKYTKICGANLAVI
jgi:hypothetical protein